MRVQVVSWKSSFMIINVNGYRLSWISINEVINFQLFVRTHTHCEHSQRQSEQISAFPNRLYEWFENFVNVSIYRWVRYIEHIL